MITPTLYLLTSLNKNRTRACSKSDQTHTTFTRPPWQRIQTLAIFSTQIHKSCKSESGASQPDMTDEFSLTSRLKPDRLKHAAVARIVLGFYWDWHSWKTLCMPIKLFSCQIKSPCRNKPRNRVRSFKRLLRVQVKRAEFLFPVALCF